MLRSASVNSGIAHRRLSFVPDQSLERRAAARTGVELLTGHGLVRLAERDGTVTGVRCRTGSGEFERERRGRFPGAVQRRAQFTHRGRALLDP